MKVATILPQSYLHMAIVDDYHMCLANFIGEPEMEAYTNFFRDQAKLGFVIMDNGLIEGNPRPIDELVVKAKLIGAHEMVLPDVFRDSKATLDAIDNAYGRSLESGINLMAVPQGNTLEEWLDCACTIIGEYREVKTIGIPKVLVDIAGRDGRSIAITELAKRSPMLYHKDIHLLGCWNSALEITIIDKLSRTNKIPTVRGVDSAFAYVYTRAGVRLDSDDRPDSLPIDFKDGRIEGNERQVNSLLKKNIQLWRRAAESRTFMQAVTDELFN